MSKKGEFDYVPHVRFRIIYLICKINRSNGRALSAGSASLNKRFGGFRNSTNEIVSEGQLQKKEK